MTWAMLSAFLFMATASVPVSEIGQIFILCAAPAPFPQSWHFSAVLSTWICIEQGTALTRNLWTESENQAGKSIRVQICRVCDAFSSFDFFWVPFYCEWLVNFLLNSSTITVTKERNAFDKCNKATVPCLWQVLYFYAINSNCLDSYKTGTV